MSIHYKKNILVHILHGEHIGYVIDPQFHHFFELHGSTSSDLSKQWRVPENARYDKTDVLPERVVNTRYPR